MDRAASGEEYGICVRRADGGSPADPSDLGVQAAVDRFLQRRQTDSSDRTLRSYRNRLQKFTDWAEAAEIRTLGELTAWHIDEYDMALRGRDLAPTTVNGYLSTLRVFLQYAENIGAVEEGLADKVDPPSLEPHEEKSEERLAEEDALAALSFFRGDRGVYAVAMHAFLEVAWHTGARMGGLRGLDMPDYDPDEQTLHFVHRPKTDTPLKNKKKGERYVGINDAVCQVLDTYIVRERSDKRDDHGRESLFATRQGRPSFTTLRAWSYLATEPCLWMECPHGRRRATCEWTERNHASECPSSRSPHRARTGAITWMLNQGIDIEDVARRVNADPATIRRYYDAATDAEEFEKRRRDIGVGLDITQDGDTNE